MILGATQASGKRLMSFDDEQKGRIPNLNNLERKKQAFQEIYQIYCSPPNLECWFNGITLAYMTTDNHHNL
jgi:hypothetical protein